MLFVFFVWNASAAKESSKIIVVLAKDKVERTKLANLGFSLDEIRDDKVYIQGSSKDLKIILNEGFEIIESYPFKKQWLMKPEKGVGLKYHEYSDVVKELNDFALNYPNLASVSSIGKSFENRDPHF